MLPERVPFSAQHSFVCFHLVYFDLNECNSSNHHCCHTRVTLLLDQGSSAIIAYSHRHMMLILWQLDLYRLSFCKVVWKGLSSSKSRLSESDPGISEVISIYMIIVIYLNFAYYICNSFHLRTLAFFLCSSPPGFGAPKRVHCSLIDRLFLLISQFPHFYLWATELKYSSHACKPKQPMLSITWVTAHFDFLINSSIYLCTASWS